MADRIFYFRARSAIGEFKELLDSLVAQVRFQEGQVPEPSVAVVDAQSVRAASYPSPKGFGRWVAERSI